MNLTDMDYVRGAIAAALAEDMTLADLWGAAEHAETPRDFDEALQLLTPEHPTGAAWTDEGWCEI